MVNPDSNYFFIHHHLGLGDHIVCNAIVRHLHDKFSSQYKSIKLAVKHHNVSSVAQLYRDINIDLYPVYGDNDCPVMYQKNNYIKIGFNHCHYPRWEKSFYDQMKLNYSYRYSNFHISRDLDREKSLEDKLKLPKKFAFCNTHCSIGTLNDSIQTDLPKVYMSPITDSIFDWIGVIEKALEIHTIDSSVFQLIKQIKHTGKNFFYKTRNNLFEFPIELNQHWSII